jgi:hypothetical protein
MKHPVNNSTRETSGNLFTKATDTADRANVPDQLGECANKECFSCVRNEEKKGITDEPSGLTQFIIWIGVFFLRVMRPSSRSSASICPDDPKMKIVDSSNRRKTPAGVPVQTPPTPAQSPERCPLFASMLLLTDKGKANASVDWVCLTLMTGQIAGSCQRNDLGNRSPIPYDSRQILSPSASAEALSTLIEWSAWPQKSWATFGSAVPPDVGGGYALPTTALTHSLTLDDR